MTLIWTLIVGLVSCLVLLFLLKILLQAIFGDLRGFAEKIKLKRKEKIIKEVDIFIEKGILDTAFSRLRSCFFFDLATLDPNFIEKVNNHHMGILSRIVVIAEKRAKRLSNIAIIEDLLLSRCEMMRSRLEAFTSRQNLLKKREKPVPEWAVGEYLRKLDEIKDRLITNQKSLESQLAQAFEEIVRDTASNEITYH